MLFFKSFIMTLAATTAIGAIPCDHCSQDGAELTKTQEIENHISTGDLSNLNVDGYQPYDDPNNHQSLPFLPFLRRYLSEERFHPEDWLDRVWPLKQRQSWGLQLRTQFERVAKAHLPEGIVLPEPLLPTKNQTLLEVYRNAAAELALEEMKTMEQKKLEFAQLKKLANDFLLASKCWWDDNCASTYYRKECGQGRVDPCRHRWKEAIYDPLREKLERKTALEGLVNLGKKLKVETNFKIAHYEESYY